MLHWLSIVSPGHRKEAYLKNFKFEMRIAPEIGPNKVIAFSEKFPGSSQGKTTKLSDTTFLMSGSKGLIEEQGGQQPNTEV